MPTTSRGAATPSPLPAEPDGKAREALALMINALDLIDASEGARIAGAHLDLAIHHLQEWVDRASSK